MGDFSEFHLIIDGATNELRRNLAAIETNVVSTFMDKILESNRIGFYGVGREGLAMKGFAMRCFHLGLNAFVVGEMTAAAVGSGDLLICSAGPGFFSTVAAISSEAQRAGCRVLLLTSQPPSPLQDFADIVIQIPATCLPPASLLNGDVRHLNRTGSADGRQSRLLMGSSYELALQLFFDVVAVLLQQRLNVDDTNLKATHTNLE
jgi:6-phospho-3-hexuloisomerase